MALRIIHEAAITPAEDVAIRKLLCVAFSGDTAIFSVTRAYNGSAPSFSVVLEEDGEIVAHIGVVDRTIRVGGKMVRVAGIQNVAVDPGYRGKGLTGQTMGLAMEEAERQGFDAGLLFCLHALEKLYARLGWIFLATTDVTRVHVGVECELPGKNIAMYYPLMQREFPEGGIHLMGDDW